MRAAATFQPALGSCCTIKAERACQQGLPFTAYFPADDYAKTLATGAARLELWTNLPFQAEDAPSSSESTGWRAYALQHRPARAGDAQGYVFHATVRCDEAAIDGVFGFTYRMVHPDGKIDWIGSPSNDGQIHVPAPQRWMRIDEIVSTAGNSSSLQEPAISEITSDDIEVAILHPTRNQKVAGLRFRIDHAEVASGIVVERTKSTWCTSRTFGSMSEISTTFGASVLVLRLSHSDQALVIMPILDDDASVQLVRSHHDGKSAFFAVNSSAISGKVRVSFAIGAADNVPGIIQACRSNAARALRTCVGEPLGLAWSAKKFFGGSLSSNIKANAPLVEEIVLSPSSSGSDVAEVSFYSDSTAVESDRDEARTSDHNVPPASDASPLRPEAGLGFCTWEAMSNPERRPYLSEVLSALGAVERRLGKGVVTSLLIDDGWQDTVQGAQDRGRLNSFDMDSTLLDVPIGKRLSNTSVLQRYVIAIKSRFPSIRHVGCWMTLAGYWDGIHAGGPIASALSGPLRVVRFHEPLRHADREWMIQGSDLDKQLFWDRAFHTLKQSGIDFVKIDAQAEWDWIGNEDRSAAFEAMEGAATRYFGPGSVIHSMAGVASLTNSSKTLHSEGLVVRMTDDFFPEVPDAHRHHLVHNAYNSLMLPEHRCDADMFSACSENLDSGDWTGYHASFRAFTDAKLWISDKVDAVNNTAVRGLVAPLLLGGHRTIQAKGQLPAHSIFDDLIASQPGPALKLVSHDRQSGCTSVGLWNSRGGHADSVDVLDLHDVVPANFQVSAFVAYSFRSKKTWILSCDRDDGRTSVSVTLKAGSWDVITFSPIVHFHGANIATVGFTDKIIPFSGLEQIAFQAVSEGDMEIRAETDDPVEVVPTNVKEYQAHYSINTVGFVSLCLVNSAIALLQSCIQTLKRFIPLSDNVMQMLHAILRKLQTNLLFTLIMLASCNPSLLEAEPEKMHKIRLSPSSLLPTVKRCVSTRRFDLSECAVTFADLSPKTATSSLTSQQPAQVSTDFKPTAIFTQEVCFISKLCFFSVSESTENLKVMINGEFISKQFVEMFTRGEGLLIQVDIPAWYAAQDEPYLQSLSPSLQVQLLV